MDKPQNASSPASSPAAPHAPTATSPQASPTVSPHASTATSSHASPTEPSTAAELHVIVGAGQIGPILAERLLARGHRVRMIRRGAGGAHEAAVPRRVEWARGDVADAAFAAEALRGATVVYHCANPARYDRWDELLAPLARAVREAAGRAGARLVVLDNLYMYGRAAADGWLREDASLAPCSHKGELRAQLHHELMAAHARGDVRVTVGRAGDFFGPRAERAAIFGAHFFARLPRGKAALVFGDPDQPHAYAYTPDVAEGLAVLGAHPEAAGGVFHLPTAWNGTTRELVSRFAAALDVAPRLLRTPRWLLRTLGLWNGELGALVEMVYQWEHAYRVDDSRFRTTFGTTATPIDHAISATLAAEGLSGTVFPS